MVGHFHLAQQLLIKFEHKQRVVYHSLFYAYCVTAVRAASAI